MNDISSDSSAFLSAEKLIACLIFSLITLDQISNETHLYMMLTINLLFSYSKV